MEGVDLVSSAASKGSGKQRMRWTPELRGCFEEAVNQLGGPDRATPKAILKTMSIPGLTIGHVKSYLQKYRMLKFSPVPSERARLESRTIAEVLPGFHATSRVQISEALQLHMEVQQTSHQLEVHRPLKIKMGLQRKYLEKIAEDHGNFSSELTSKRYFTSTPPVLPGVSEPDVWKQNSEPEVVNAGPNSSLEDFQTPKRSRVADDVGQS